MQVYRSFRRRVYTRKKQNKIHTNSELFIINQRGIIFLLGRNKDHNLVLQSCVSYDTDDRGRICPWYEITNI